MNLTSKLDQLPPFLCHAYAHSRRKRPTLNELVDSSGLSLRTFTRIARRHSWSNVKVSQVDAFSRACGIDWNHLHPIRQFIRRTLLNGKRWAHLKPRQWRTFQKQCEQFQRVTA